MRSADVVAGGMYAWSTRQDGKYALPVVIADLRMVLADSYYRRPVKLKLTPAKRSQRGRDTAVGLVAVPVCGPVEKLDEWLLAGREGPGMPTFVHNAIARAKEWSAYVMTLSAEQYGEFREPLYPILPGNRTEGDEAFLANPRSLVNSYATYVSERDTRNREQIKEQRREQERQGMLRAEYDRLCGRLSALNIEIFPSEFEFSQFGRVTLPREDFRRLVELAEKGAINQ
jgi:hypothetical protein